MKQIVPARVIERVLDRVVMGPGECVISTYSRQPSGYAQVGWHEGGQTVTVYCHQVAWVAAYGAIPDDLTVDHRCRVRPCVNRLHLRLLPNVDNAKDNGMARRTHCPAGHPYDERNTYVDTRGHRRCRACGAERDRVRRA